MNKIITIFLLILIVGSGVYADVVENGQSFTSTYLFHLYYDNGQLFADRDIKFKYDIIAEEFTPEILNTQFPYKGEVINFNNQVAFTFQFDPRQGNPKFLKGKISVKAPYLPDGQKVVFYDSLGQSLLTIFVSESSFCNDDGVCNSEVGEDSKTCPLDCKTATPPPTGGPTSPTEPSASGGGGMIKVLIYLIIGLGVVGGGWKWWKKRQELPSTQFPTNTSPPPSLR